MDRRVLSTQDYLCLVDGARLIKRDKRRLEILLTPKNDVIKFIYKPRFSIPKKIFNETRRFVENAEILREQEIQGPEVVAVYYYPALKCNIIVYKYIMGYSLYDLACRKDFTKLSMLPGLISRLHAAGFYFGDLHLGNIISVENNLALIDIESIIHKGRPLNLKERIANLKYMFSLKRDVPIYQQFGFDAFLEHYFLLSNMTNAMEIKIRDELAGKMGNQVPPPLTPSTA